MWRSWVTACLGSVVVGADAILLAQDAERRARRLALVRTASEPNLEELSAVRSERLVRALESQEAPWAFVTSPEPMYLERRAAAVQGRKLVPLDWLPRIWATVSGRRST
jgi:hypothetical protein